MNADHRAWSPVSIPRFPSTRVSGGEERWIRLRVTYGQLWLVSNGRKKWRIEHKIELATELELYERGRDAIPQWSRGPTTTKTRVSFLFSCQDGERTQYVTALALSKIESWTSKQLCRRSRGFICFIFLRFSFLWTLMLSEPNKRQTRPIFVTAPLFPAWFIHDQRWESRKAEVLYTFPLKWLSPSTAWGLLPFDQREFLIRPLRSPSAP